MAETTKPRLRHELKYPLTLLEYEVLRKKLAAVLQPDPHAGPDGSYHIRSLYFDDFKNSAFFEKQAGVARRKKYRIRIYNCNDNCVKLERKTKLDQYIRKETTCIIREDAENMIVGNVSFLSGSKNPLLRDFYLECRSSLLRSVVMVDYLREAYVYPVGNVRITLDTQLHTGLGCVDFFCKESCTAGVVAEDGITLEVKFDEVLPLHIRGLFPDTVRPRCSLGKFAACKESAFSAPSGFVKRF
ncbi:MAG: vacuolar transporter [Candidatus Bathyarchaeum sp.]|nr:MAG: vacuolar transporter [Candidatus Bathyarchaeum sp.]